MAGGAKKKPKPDATDLGWAKIRHTATQTEIQNNDTEVRDLIKDAEALDPALIVIQGDMVGKVFRLKDGRTLIGRHPNCNISVHQRAISGFHAEIRRTEAGIILEDLGSTNGTIHN